jgi:hypothetical protein
VENPETLSLLHFVVLYFLGRIPILEFMKQKNSNQTPATKADLDEKLSNYPTKINMDLKLEKLEMRIDKKAKEYRDQVLNKLDDVIRELEQLREDRLFMMHDIKEVTTRVDVHEERIKKLEKHAPIS